MPEARVSHIIGRWLATSGSMSGLGDARDYLQRRVTTYVKTLCYFFGFFCLAALSRALVFQLVLAEPLQAAEQWWAVAVMLGIASITAAAWWLLARAPRGQAWLHAVEMAGTVVCASIIAWTVYLLPAEAPPLAIFFGVVLVLVIRAALVPSRAPVTLLVGLAATAAATVPVYQRYQELDLHGLIGRRLWLVAMAWGLIFTAATTVVSQVIYGLQQKVRDAMRLGNYTLEQKLGEGGMGVVYLARHALLKRPTAVKLLPPQKLGPDTIKRFEREVQRTSRLMHPNTVAIYDYGRTDDGVFYYAMEYLDGIDLEQLAELDGPQEPGRVIHVLAQVAHALAEAHGEGLIHRDIKPGNIVLCDRAGIADMAKLVDFGLVKDLDSSDPLLSRADVITGTPLYMAPEAITAPSSVDRRTDIYALGAVGYFMLTARPVFDGASLVEVCSQHLHIEPVPPSRRLRRELPADLEQVLLSCLAKKPADRPDDALALRAALLACKDAGSWGLAEAAAWWRATGEAVARKKRARAPEPSEEAAERSEDVARQTSDQASKTA
jgi:serine/threonine-protein kinase